MQNSIYKIKYLLFLSWDWEAWCLTQAGGNTPPHERNTAWNRGRKFFHCLGAPNNLIRPWLTIRVFMKFFFIQYNEDFNYSLPSCQHLIWNSLNLLHKIIDKKKLGNNYKIYQSPCENTLGYAKSAVSNKLLGALKSFFFSVSQLEKNTPESFSNVWRPWI